MDAIRYGWQSSNTVQCNRRPAPPRAERSPSPSSPGLLTRTKQLGLRPNPAAARRSGEITTRPGTRGAKNEPHGLCTDADEGDAAAVQVRAGLPAHCKSVGLAYEGSNPSPATPRETAPELRKRSQGPFSWCPVVSGAGRCSASVCGKCVASRHEARQPSPAQPSPAQPERQVRCPRQRIADRHRRPVTARNWAATHR
jgi:hypothetical protein